MGSVSDAVCVAELIITCLTKIHQLGKNWYLTSAAWDRFPSQIQEFKEKYSIWSEESSKRGLSDPLLNDCLKTAREALKEEEEKLELRKKKSASRRWRCWHHIGPMLFPEQLGKELDVAIQAFGNIKSTLEFREAVVGLADRAMKQMSFSKRVTEDNRYVPLKATEDKIYGALDDDEGPTVVLLHGGAGKGKSTLAQHVYAFYKPNKAKFAHVQFLDCGKPEANVEDMHLELVQRLGYELMSADSNVDTGSMTQSKPQSGGNSKSIQVRKRLQGLLTSQSMLFILDDVKDPEFLRGIVDLCGDRVKCLVTSQEATLCNHMVPSKYLDVPIDEIEPEDALKILASHVGFPDKKIPPHLLETANKMVEQADCHPLALANLAGAIDHDRSLELEAWEEAASHMLEVLQENIATTLFNGTYPRSFFASMKLSMDSLRDDSRKLLLLACFCEGPEEVFNILHKKKRFSIYARRELENRQFIKINKQALDSPWVSSKEPVMQRTWTVPSLIRKYISQLSELKGEADDLIRSLLGETEEVASNLPQVGEVEKPHEVKFDQVEKRDSYDTLVTSLCALYVEMPGIDDKAASKLNTSPSNFSASRRTAIEPVTGLLGRTVNERWTEVDHNCARKVFFAYIIDGVLDEANILRLMESPIAAPSMWMALKDIAKLAAFVEDRRMLDDSTKKILQELLRHMRDEVESAKQEVALQTLSYFAYNELQNMYMVSFPGVLEQVTRLLTTSSDPAIQRPCVGTLMNLAWNQKMEYVGNEVSKKRRTIIDFPGAVDGLLAVLCKDGSPGLQENALAALQNLASGSADNKAAILVNHPRVLPEVVSCLYKESSADVQAQAAKTLTTIAIGVLENKVKIMNHKGALEGLVTLLYKTKEEPYLPFYAAYCLSTLANAVLVDDVAADPVKTGLVGAKDVEEGLLQNLDDEVAVVALTLINTARANQAGLPSGFAYRGRARGNLLLKKYDECFADLAKALEFELGDYFVEEALSIRFAAKALTQHYEEALADLDKLIESRRSPKDDNSFDGEALGYMLQERGVVKKLKGDLLGALADLDEAVAQYGEDYEVLKQRGLVKYELGREDEARADAEWAQRIQYSYVNQPEYAVDYCFGVKTVEYLGFKL
ncbi:unnamed protein product [Calypogeia fissa]